MSIEMEMERLRAEIEELRERLRQLGQELAGWEAVAMAGDTTIDEREAARLGLVRKIREAKNLMEDLPW
jgi:chromosome segregation ATPase